MVLIDERISKKVTNVVTAIEKDLKQLDNRDLVFAALAKVLDIHFHALEDETIRENVLNQSKLTEEAS